MEKLKPKRKKTKKNQPNERKWHLIDAKNVVLGRLSTKIANLLRGKDKIYFVPYRDMGDYVVVINATEIAVSSKKLEQKIYYTHSGYLGSLKKTRLKEMLKDKPEEVIYRAVSGMLPKNKLKNGWLKKLYVFPKEEHRFSDKFKNAKDAE